MTGDSCLTELPPEVTEYNLTCCVTNARPAVDLQWIRILDSGSTVKVVDHVFLRVWKVGDLHNETRGKGINRNYKFHDQNVCRR